MEQIVSIEKITESVVRFRITSESGRVWIVHRGTYRKLGLQSGDEVDPDTLSENIETLERAEARESAVRSLSLSGRSRNELAEMLLRKGFSEGQAEDTLSWVLENGFIDEATQLEDFVESRIGREGTVRLKQRLLTKGYAKRDIDEALKRFEGDDAQYTGALELAQRKAPLYQEKDPTRWKDKLWAWLYGKGYSSDVIRRVLKNF